MNSRLTVDLGAVVANWRRLAQLVAPAACAAVVKADAYGLGAAQVAPALAEAGCRMFFVAQLDEGIALRRVLPAGPGGVEVAVLGGVLPGTEDDFGAYGLLPVLNHLGEIACWGALAAGKGAAQPALIHLDTGMSRLGLGPAEQAVLVQDRTRLAGIAVRGWLSHFACADVVGHPMTAAQLVRFADLLAQLPAAPASLANSSGIFRGRACHRDLVRPGCALYGINPTPEAANPMRPVVRLEGRVLQVRSVDRGATVGYGAGHVIARNGRIATVGVGYADGYLRSLGNTGTLLVGGVAAPVVGRVSMDLITADVSDLPEGAVEPGDWVDLIGPHRSVDQVAAEAGTIGYEILTSLGGRTRRIYSGP